MFFRQPAFVLLLIGIFAVSPWNKANKFYLYDRYGNLLKQVKHPAGAGYTLDCAFIHKFLYVADLGGRIHKLCNGSYYELSLHMQYKLTAIF